MRPAGNCGDCKYSFMIAQCGLDATLACRAGPPLPMQVPTANGMALTAVYPPVDKDMTCWKFDPEPRSTQ